MGLYLYSAPQALSLEQPTFAPSLGFLQRRFVLSRSVVSDTFRPHGLYPTRLLCPWNSPGKNTEVGSHSLLQRILLTQGSNLGLLYFRQILYHLSHQGPSQSKSNIRVWLIGLLGHFQIMRLLERGKVFIPTSFRKLKKKKKKNPDCQ